jgi:hypothetical protein
MNFSEAVVKCLEERVKVSCSIHEAGALRPDSADLHSELCNQVVFRVGAETWALGDFNSAVDYRHGPGERRGAEVGEHPLERRISCICPSRQRKSKIGPTPAKSFATRQFRKNQNLTPFTRLSEPCWIDSAIQAES